MEKAIKISLIFLLFGCLLSMPYGYFQLVRFVAFIGFGYLAFKANQRNNQFNTFAYTALSVLFQPFFKIALGRELWNIIDVIIAVYLLVSFFKVTKRNE